MALSTKRSGEEASIVLPKSSATTSPPATASTPTTPSQKGALPDLPKRSKPTPASAWHSEAQKTLQSSRSTPGSGNLLPPDTFGMQLLEKEAKTSNRAYLKPAQIALSRLVTEMVAELRKPENVHKNDQELASVAYDVLRRHYTLHGDRDSLLRALGCPKGKPKPELDCDTSSFTVAAALEWYGRVRGNPVDVGIVSMPIHVCIQVDGVYIDRGKVVTDADLQKPPLSLPKAHVKKIRARSLDDQLKLTEARSLAQQGKHKEALAIYDELKVTRENDYDVLCGRADTLEDLNKEKAAIGAYQAVLDLYGDDPYIQYRQSLLYRDLGNKAQADRVLSRAQKNINPQSVHNCLWRAQLLVDEEKYDDAMQAIDVGMKLHPLGAMFRLRGEIFAARNQDDRAVQAFQKATELSPDDSNAQLGLGKVLMKQARGCRNDSQREQLEARAITAFRSALDINERDAEIWMELGQALRKDSQASEAIHAFRMATELEPKDEQPLFSLGQKLVAAHCYEEAAHVFETLERMWPEEGMKQRLMALERLAGVSWTGSELRLDGEINSTERQRYLADLMDAYEQAAAEFPKEARFLFRHGLLLEHRGKLDEAASSMSEALQLQPNNQFFQNALDRVADRLATES